MSKYNVSKSEAKRLGIKRVKLGSSKSSSKEKDIDYSKRPSGVSKREWAAQQSGGKLDYSSGDITVKAKPKYVPTKATSSSKYAGPSLPGQVQEGYYDWSDTDKVEADRVFNLNNIKKEREKATKKSSQAQKTTRQKAASFKNILGGTASASTGSPTVAGATRDNAQYLNQAPNRNFVQRGWDSLYNNLFNRKDYRYESGFKDPAQDQPTGYGPNGEMYYNNYDPSTSMPSSLRSDFATPGTNFSRPGSEEAYLKGTSPIAYGKQQRDETATYGSQATPTQYNPSGIQSNIVPENRPSAKLPQSSQYKNPFTTNPFQAEPQGMSVAPREYAPEVAPEQTYNQPTGQNYLSTGALGNGAGLAGGLDPETQAYMDRLQASLGGDYGKSDLEDQIKNLLDGISKRYAEEQRLGEKELGESKVSDLNKLSSLFGAYNTADSEQRMQTEQRTQADYADALTELIARLTASKGQEITDVKNKGVQGLRDIDTAKRQAESNVADLIYKAQMDARDRQIAQQNKASSYSGTTKTSPLSHNEIFNWTQDALEKGYGWADILDIAKQQGIPINTGGYLDQLLHDADKSGGFRV